MKSVPLTRPFHVFATQNPIELEGTYPLPEAQLDRFMFNIMIDYLNEDDELEVVTQTTSVQDVELQQVFNGEDMLNFMRLVRMVPVAEPIARYAVQLAQTSRPAFTKAPEFIRKWIDWGAGTRGSQNLILAAKTRALLNGHYHVSCADIRAVAAPVFRHRILDQLSRRSGSCRYRRDYSQIVGNGSGTPVRSQIIMDCRVGKMQNEYNVIDPIILSRISDLMLLARTVVDGFTAGLHRSASFGSSIEFAQYRPYVQGDDPRFVDWDLYARTDRLHTKQFQEDSNLRCVFLIDCSASMAYASGEVTKFQYARMLAACLTMLLIHQKDTVGLIGFQHDINVYIPPRKSPQHLRRILVELDQMNPKGKTDIGKVLQYLGDVLPSRGMVVLISDLLYPADEFLQYLKILKARHHDVLICQISDPAEQSFPFDQSKTFIDAESENEQFIVPDSVRAEYLENRNRHFDEIRNECLAVEMDLEEFTTSEPLDRALHYFLMRRIRTCMASSGRRNRAVTGGG